MNALAEAWYVARELFRRHWYWIVPALFLIEAVTHGGPTEPNWR